MFGYFCYRYVVKMGFLDGKEGFCWDFFQGLWYRMLVDAKVFQAKKSLELKGYSLKNLSEEGKKELKEYIRKEWGIRIG